MNIMQLCRPDPNRTNRGSRDGVCCSRLAAVLFLLFFHPENSSCASLDHEIRPFSIKRLESTRIKWIGEKDSIAWLDNDRLLVAGYAPSTKDLGDDSPKAPPAGMYEWNVKTDELTLHSPLGKTWFCYAYGYIRYVVKKNGELSVKEGQYGQEEEKAFYAMPNMDRSTCKPYGKCSDGPRGGSLCRLPGGHGYMELGRDRLHSVNINPEPHNLWYYPTVDHPGTELPIAYHDADWNGIVFSQYANAYVIPQDYTIPGRNPPVEGRAWMLSLDGRTQEILPPKTVPTRANSIQPIKDGFISSAGSFVMTERFKVGTAGAYIWNESTSSRLFPGWISQLKISPDGCNMAAIFNPWTSSYRDTALNVVKFCTK